MDIRYLDIEKIKDKKNDTNDLESNKQCSWCSENANDYEIVDTKEIICNNCLICFDRCKDCNIILTNEKQKYCKTCYNTYNICKVTENLYISDYNSSKYYDSLKKLGITQILTVASELKQHSDKEFRTMKISLNDNPDEDIRSHFATAYDFIEKGPTLVHCYAGISRSATIVISYLMIKNSMSYNDAKDLCKKARPIICPNSGFVQQLLDFEKELELCRKYSESDIPFNLEDLLAYTCFSLNNEVTEIVNNKKSNIQTVEENTSTDYMEDSSDQNEIMDLCDKIFNAALYKYKITLYPLGRKIFENIADNSKL